MPSKDLLITDSSAVDGESFATLVAARKASFADHRRVLVRLQSPVAIAATLIAARNSAIDLYLCHGHFTAEEVEIFSDRVVADLVGLDGEVPGDVVWATRPGDDRPPGGALHLFTSGTTGDPKIVAQSWERIQTSSWSAKRLSDCTWLMCYSPTSYAGLQVFFAALNNQGRIYFPSSNQTMPFGMVEHGVQVVSATPTFWRLMINAWPADLPVPKLVQATLGGEIVTQDILDRIQTLFTPDHLTHIYASTEAGSVIVVSDRRAGFPVSFLDRESGAGLRISPDQTLQIRSAQGMLGYVNREQQPFLDEAWMESGDLVEVVDGRVYFRGRQDAMINVGGAKVAGEEVEGVLLGLTGIRECLVYGKSNPIVGTVVAADVVLDPGETMEGDGIRTLLKPLLPSYKIPQLIRFVAEIEVSQHGKKFRK